MNKAVPAFRFSPQRHAQIQKLRLNVDIIGVTLVRYLAPLVHVEPLALILSIYNVMGWVTILTVDSTRVPEYTTTRIKQRKAWVHAVKWAPLTAVILGVVSWMGHLPILPVGTSTGVMIGVALGSLIPAYLDELLFRNVLQPKLRQFGLSRALAIGLQSVLYAAAIAVQHPSIPFAVMALWIGISNGWMVYKYRSLWPAFVVSLIWHVLWF